MLFPLVLALANENELCGGENHPECQPPLECEQLGSILAPGRCRLPGKNPNNPLPVGTRSEEWVTRTRSTGMPTTSVLLTSTSVASVTQPIATATVTTTRSSSLQAALSLPFWLLLL
jgi:hypothetical protein